MKPTLPPMLADLLANALSRTGRLARSGRLMEASAAIQRALRGTPVRFAAERPAASTAAAETLVERVEPEQQAIAPAQFLAGSHAEGSARRSYKLFVPAGFAGQRLPLIVMLHGCTQDPDDFAAGTRMNEAAQALGMLVLYPAQAPRSNASKCWNWFQPGDQRRGQGEPELLAGMTRSIVQTHRVDPDRVYVAGLSAGGAMAVILAREYPDIFAAVGVHSGLPQGAAHDIASAFAAMKGGAAPLPAREGSGSGVPAIVFHGDADTTVHPGNGAQVIADLLQAGGASVATERGVAAGRGFTRAVHRDAAGLSRAELWQIEGAGHAWSGGSASGSYTDARGPDATREMLRFFLEHRQRGRN